MEFSSILSPGEIWERVKAKGRPWSRLDMWTARGTWFYRIMPDGAPKLIRTGRVMGHVSVRLMVEDGADGGSQVKAVCRIPGTVFAAEIVIPALCIVCCLLWAAFARDVRMLSYVPVLALYFGFYQMLRREIPDILQELRDELT